MFQQQEGKRERELSQFSRNIWTQPNPLVWVRKAGICMTGEFFQTHLKRYDELNIGCRKLNPSVYKIWAAASEVNSQSTVNMNSLHKRFLSYVIPHLPYTFRIGVYCWREGKKMQHWSHQGWIERKDHLQQPAGDALPGCWWPSRPWGEHDSSGTLCKATVTCFHSCYSSAFEIVFYEIKLGNSKRKPVNSRLNSLKKSDSPVFMTRDEQVVCVRIFTYT